MKIIRFEWDKTPRYGIVDGDSVFLLEGDILSDFGPGKKLCNLGDVKPLATGSAEYRGRHWRKLS